MATMAIPTVLSEDDDREDALIVRDDLCAVDLLAVAEGRALALRVDGYYSAEACSTLAERLLAAPLWTTYGEGTGAEGIGTIGDSLFGCLGQELCPSYFETGERLHPELRRIVHPYMLPVDRVLLELDHAWPHGAGLLHIGSKPAFYGLIRMFREGGAALAHTDRADWDYPSVETAGLLAQLFVNVYLSKTTFGGSVRLWEKVIHTRGDYDRLRLAPGHYALDEARLPEPALEIDVPVGSLLIANAWKAHAVTECRGDGTRVSVSGFIGYAGPDAALRTFS